MAKTVGIVVVSAAAALLSLAIQGEHVARADPHAPNPAVEQLFAQARALAAAGRYVEACPKFEETLRLDGGIGVRFNLADCHEHVGRLATAWAEFRETAAAAALSAQPERERVAVDRARALEGHLCRLRIDLGPLPVGSRVTVMRDGAVIGEAQLGQLIPVDPGVHRVSATGVQIAPWSAEVRVDGCPANVNVRIPSRLIAESSLPPKSPTGLHSAPPMATTKKVAVASLVAGGVFVGAGVASLAYALVRKGDSSSWCQNDACFPEGLAARNDAVRAGNAATVLLASGVAMTGVGLSLWFWPTSHPSAPAVSIGANSLVLRGNFR